MAWSDSVVATLTTKRRLKKKYLITSIPRCRSAELYKSAAISGSKPEKEVEYGTVLHRMWYGFWGSFQYKGTVRISTQKERKLERNAITFYLKFLLLMTLGALWSTLLLANISQQPRRRWIMLLIISTNGNGDDDQEIDYIIDQGLWPDV